MTADFQIDSGLHYVLISLSHFQEGGFKKGMNSKICFVSEICRSFNPSSSNINIHILLSVSTNSKNLLKYQDILSLVIISLILMTGCVFD